MLPRGELIDGDAWARGCQDEKVVGEWGEMAAVARAGGAPEVVDEATKVCACNQNFVPGGELGLLRRRQVPCDALQCKSGGKMEFSEALTGPSQRHSEVLGPKIFPRPLPHLTGVMYLASLR